MKIIVTGSLGHIGSRLIRDLPECLPNSHVVLIDSFLTQRYASLFNLPNTATYELIEGDVIESELERVFSDANIVIHLAAITDAASSFNNPKQVAYNNFESTKRIAKLAEKNGVAMIFPSSTSVYGTQDEKVDEFCSNEQLKPQSPYAESKLKEENYLQSLAKEGELKLVILRLGTIFGVSQGMRFHTAVNKFCWQAVLGQALTVWETAYEQYRPYLDLTDAVKAMNYFIQNKLFDGNIYNVVTSNHTVHEIVDIIKSHLPETDVQFIEHKIMNQLSYHVLNARLNETDFQFSGSIQQGIEETINLIKNMNSRPL